MMNLRKKKNMAKGKEVSNEEKGPQDRALGNICRDRGRLGLEGLELNELSAAGEV